MAWQNVSALLFENSLDLNCPAGTYALAAATLALLLQGAGIYIEPGGEATLTNTNVYENEAGAYLVSAVALRTSQTVASRPA